MYYRPTLRLLSYSPVIVTEYDGISITFSLNHSLALYVIFQSCIFNPLPLQYFSVTFMSCDFSLPSVEFSVVVVTKNQHIRV